MRILVVMVCTGTGRQSESLRLLKDLHAIFRDGWEREYLVVDNALAPETCEMLSPGTTLIGGDNALREFSGFDRLFPYLGTRLGQFDVVNIVTETFNADYQYYLGLFTPKMLSLVEEKNIALGHIDDYPEDVTLFGERSRSWIRTCYFYLSGAAVRQLGTFLTTDGNCRLFSDDPRKPFDQQAVICPLYQKYLMRWLTGQEDGFTGVDVHRNRFSLNEETFERFKFKVVSILNEHGLSIRLRKQDIQTIDVEWLHDMLLTRSVSKINWHVPIKEMLRFAAERRQRLGVMPP